MAGYGTPLEYSTALSCSSAAVLPAPSSTRGSDARAMGDTVRSAAARETTLEASTSVSVLQALIESSPTVCHSCLHQHLLE